MNDAHSQKLTPSHPLLEGIAIATNKLLTIQDDQGAIQQAITALGQATQVDRIYIFENHPHSESGELLTSQRWEWVAPGVIPEIDNPALQGLSYTNFVPRWQWLLSQGKTVSGWVEDFPDSERELLGPQGIQSILVVPIMIRDHFWGFIGFDDCHHKRVWEEAEQSALTALGGSIGGAIIQRRSEIQIRELNHILEQRVRDRTQELQAEKENAEAKVRDRTRELQQEKEKAEQRSQVLEQTLRQLQQAQAQLIQTEKMSALGELVAGIAHEINNPVSFIYGNLTHAESYLDELFNLITLYEQHYPDPHPDIQGEQDAIDLEFLKIDFPDMLDSMRLGTNRIVEIVRSLRTFSRTDESHWQPVDLHQHLNETLTILQMRLKEASGIEVKKQYGVLPPVDCYAGQLSQVFMNIISNAIDALDEQRQEKGSTFQGVITICTEAIADHVSIQITDNGPGIDAETQTHLFESFFTTKAVGKGTGLGLAIAHRIVTQKHRGTLTCTSAVGQGTTFTLTLPIAIAGKPAGESAASPIQDGEETGRVCDRSP